jgi:predicted Na+-dependent transporter
MTLNDFFSAIAGISGLLFVVTSMLAMSLSLSMQQMTQPLKNIRLVILALLANFVLVPLLGLAIIKIIPLDQSLQVGVILLATAAGAPFIPKLVQGAKSLIVTMLIPLVIGMLIKSHSPDVADHWAPVMQKISSLSILILLVVGLGLNISNIIGFIGTRGIGAMIILIIGALLIGLLFGGRDPGARSAMGLSTANRNGAAALLVATQNFSGTNTLPFVLVGTVIMLLILLPVAKRMGASKETPASEATN